MEELTFRISMYHKANKWFCGSHAITHGVTTYKNVAPNIYEEYFYSNQFLVLDYTINELVKELLVDYEYKGTVFEEGKIVERIRIKRSPEGDKFQITDKDGKLLEERDLNDNIKRVAVKTESETVCNDTQSIPKQRREVSNNTVKKSPGNKSKKDLVLEMFNNKGDSVHIQDLIKNSGFDLQNLKTFISIMRNVKKTKPENLRVFKIEGELVSWVE